MRTVILYDAPARDAAADALDVMLQVRAVAGALRGLGHEVFSVRFSLDLNSVAAALTGLAPDLVFNLVEGANGKGRYIHLAPSLLEDMGLAFSGAGSSAMALSSNKLFAKVVMRSAGIPTPPWRSAADLGRSGGREKKRYLIKSVWEHASVGLEDDCIVEVGACRELAEPLRRLAPRLGGECFAERFVQGREFNVAVLDGPDGPTVLPPAEIRFTGMPEGAARIVGYQAKWDEDSPLYHGTQRSFDIADAGLVEALGRQTLECWRAFGLSGYARVDFRLDEGEGPQVIDVNANPCLSPDAGYAAMLEQAGMPFAAALQRVVAAALRRHGESVLGRAA